MSEIYASLGWYIKGLAEEFGKNGCPAVRPLFYHYDEEKAYVSDTVSHISDKKVRESLQKAMTADLEWKKGKK